MIELRYSLGVCVDCIILNGLSVDEAESLLMTECDFGGTDPFEYTLAVMAYREYVFDIKGWF